MKSVQRTALLLILVVLVAVASGHEQGEERSPILRGLTGTPSHDIRGDFDGIDWKPPEADNEDKNKDVQKRKKKKLRGGNGHKKNKKKKHVEGVKKHDHNGIKRNSTGDGTGGVSIRPADPPKGRPSGAVSQGDHGRGNAHNGVKRHSTLEGTGGVSIRPADPPKGRPTGDASQGDHGRGNGRGHGHGRNKKAGK